jgi:FkbH-like protein
MYETETNHRIDTSENVPRRVIEQFGELRGMVLARTVLPWSEHCTECVMPACYSTCDLYSAREDGRCRRFVDGMVRVACAEAPNSYILKIRFKRWGKLWSPGNIRLHSAVQAEKIEQRDYQIGTVLYQLPVPLSLKGVVTGQRYRFKKRLANRPERDGDLPTSFLVECYNPHSYSIRISLTIRPANEDKLTAFQSLIHCTPGFHRVRFSVKEIRKLLDVRSPFNIDLIPNNVEDGTTLYFGLMEFVQEAAQIQENTKTIKCIVWDLDHTIWTGTLVEDGPLNLKLKPEIVQVLKVLDSRGILHSIASKNDHREAMQALKSFKVDEFFLCPQISWRPKSEAISTIARGLNISTDSLLMVDDSQFELEQVKTAYPEVRILDAAQYRSLPNMRECQVPVTAESRERRKMYHVEAKRQEVAVDFGADYMAFLSHCQIQLSVCHMTEENLDRVHELTQRTNQMNFSGNRYRRDVLRGILEASYLSTYVLSCDDRFGSYGIVGFSIVDIREPRMTDLMFSCRVQSKRVEHAFLGHIIRASISERERDFFANYRKTSRNAASGRVFADLGMEELGISDGVTSLVFPRNKEVPDDGIIKIVVQEDALPGI